MGDNSANEKRSKELVLGGQFQALFGALGQASSAPPANLAIGLRRCPSVGTLPSPWVTWLLICLFCHRMRQQWGRQMIETHLGGIFRRPDARSQKKLFLPVAPEWEIRHQITAGQVATLANRVTGEQVHLDVSLDRGEGPVFIESWLYLLKSESRWEPAGRLRELHPYRGTVALAIADMEDGGALEKYDTSPRRRSHRSISILHGAYRLCGACTCHAEVVERFCRTWSEYPERRLWLAALMGDWLLAHELAVIGGDAELINLTRGKATKCRQKRSAMVRQRIRNDNEPSAMLLHALNECRAPDLPKHIRRWLRSSRDVRWFTFADEQAISYIMEANDPDWCTEVWRLLERMESDSEDKLDYLAVMCAEYLAKHGFRAEEAIDLALRHDNASYELAVLAIEHAPGVALPIVRRALRSRRKPKTICCCGNISENSLAMAAVLAIIDLPWSRHELLTALAEVNRRQTELSRGLPFVMALGESEQADARQAASAWLDQYHPSDYRYIAERFNLLLRSFHDRSMTLRSHPIEGDHLKPRRVVVRRRTADPFKFHPELFAMRSDVLEALSAKGFAWPSDFGSVDLRHDEYGLEVTGIRQEADAEMIASVLRTMFPRWRYRRMYFEDENIGEIGWKVIISREPERFDDDWKHTA